MDLTDLEMTVEVVSFFFFFFLFFFPPFVHLHLQKFLLIIQKPQTILYLPFLLFINLLKLHFLPRHQVSSLLAHLLFLNPEHIRYLHQLPTLPLNHLLNILQQLRLRICHEGEED